MVQGAAIGIMSILRPLTTVEVMGRENFGAVSGAIATGPMLGTAVGPTLGALIFAHGGPAGIALASSAMMLLALAMVSLIRRGS